MAAFYLLLEEHSLDNKAAFAAQVRRNLFIDENLLEIGISATPFAAS